MFFCSCLFHCLSFFSMSKSFFSFLLLSFSLLILGGGCTQSNTSQTQSSSEVTVQADVSVLVDGGYVLNAEESTLAWESGKKLIPNYTHNGTVGIKSGNVVVE